MSIEEKLSALAAEKAKVIGGGGPERTERQHRAGKLTARERLAQLFDQDSFTELDMFARHRCIEFGMDRTEAPGEGVVTGFGRVDGRPVYAFAQDFTVIGGSLGEAHASKIVKVMEMAAKVGAPLVGINDSGGARIQEGIDALDGYGRIFFRNTLSSGVIPQISVIAGPCAGGAVYSPALTDFVFMVDKTSQMFITGPQVIKAVTGEDVSLEDLGGSPTHNQTSGVAHFHAAGEAECLAQVKKLLSFLPANNLEDPPEAEPTDDPERRDPALAAAVPADPNRPYDVRDVIRPILDHGDLFETHQWYAANMVTGFARLDGQVIGVVANQPKVLAGCIDINASDKAARFVRFCDSFNIPLLTFVDTPGYLPGTAQEYGGIIRHGAKLLFAYSEATVPKLTVVLRKAYGGAYLAMCSRSLGADFSAAWPTAEIAVMGPEGAANIIFRRDIEQAGDPVQTRRDKEAEYRARFATPYPAAARGYIEAVIAPEDSRPVLIEVLRSLRSKRESRPAKKHGNIPL
ncbi:MAG: carboxyl transferase domain-containing protein [Bacillota bacterium]|nr:carboxyl transferase domain-containing protein [Bacillota bacterium]